MSRFCTECGGPLANDAVFCESCGHRDDETVPSSAAPPRVSPASGPPPHAAATPKPPSPAGPAAAAVRVPRKLLAIVGGALLVLIAVIVFFAAWDFDQGPIQDAAAKAAIDAAKDESSADVEDFSLEVGLPGLATGVAVSAEARDQVISSRDQRSANVKLSLNGTLRLKPNPGSENLLFPERGATAKFTVPVRVAVEKQSGDWTASTVETTGPMQIATVLPSRPTAAEAKVAGTLAARAAEALLSVDTGKSGFADKYRAAQAPFYLSTTEGAEDDARGLPDISVYEQVTSGVSISLAEQSLADDDCYGTVSSIKPSKATATASAIEPGDHDELLQHVVASGRIAATIQDVPCGGSYFEDPREQDMRMNARFRAELVRSRLDPAAKWYIGRMAFVTGTDESAAISTYDESGFYVDPIGSSLPGDWFASSNADYLGE